MTVQCSVEAFAKAVFHAFKFPTQSVFGLLVGKRLQDVTFVVDAVPIMHTLPASSPHPVLETALLAVSSYVKSKGLVVLGLYVANERLNDNTISVHTTSVIKNMLQSEKVSSGGSGLVMWQLQNDKMKSATLFDRSVPVVQYLYTTTGAEANQIATTWHFAQWSTDTCATARVDEERALVATNTAITNFEYAKLIDFEEHLENVSLDFFNEKTVKVPVA